MIFIIHLFHISIYTKYLFCNQQLSINNFFPLSIAVQAFFTQNTVYIQQIFSISNLRILMSLHYIFSASGADILPAIASVYGIHHKSRQPQKVIVVGYSRVEKFQVWQLR